MLSAWVSGPPQAGLATEDVEVRGHIIDSLILPKILDCISASGGSFRIKEIVVGQARRDPSYARIEVHAANERLASTGYRTLAFACRDLAPGAQLFFTPGRGLATPNVPNSNRNLPLSSNTQTRLCPVSET